MRAASRDDSHDQRQPNRWAGELAVEFGDYGVASPAMPARGDEIFVTELIRQKHVMVVHGSGFGQRPGTQHFRIVFLPDEKLLTTAYSAIGDFLRERYT